MSNRVEPVSDDEPIPSGKTRISAQSIGVPFNRAGLMMQANPQLFDVDDEVLEVLRNDPQNANNCPNGGARFEVVEVAFNDPGVGTALDGEDGGDWDPKAEVALGGSDLTGGDTERR